MDYTSFLPESTYVYFYQEGIHYRTAHKYSTEAVSNASRLINNLLYLDSVVTQYTFRSRLSRAANLLLKIAFFRFSLSEFVYDTDSIHERLNKPGDQRLKKYKGPDAGKKNLEDIWALFDQMAQNKTNLTLVTDSTHFPPLNICDINAISLYGELTQLKAETKKLEAEKVRSMQQKK